MEEQIEKLKESNWQVAAQQAIDKVATEYSLTKEEVTIICQSGDLKPVLVKELWKEVTRILLEKVK